MYLVNRPGARGHRMVSSSVNRIPGRVMSRSRLRTFVLPVFALVVLAAAVAGPGLAARKHATASVTVTATEFKFKLSKTTVAHGSVTFTLVNKGKLSHDFKINGKKTL